MSTMSTVTFGTVQSFTRAGSWGGSGGQDPPEQAPVRSWTRAGSWGGSGGQDPPGETRRTGTVDARSSLITRDHGRRPSRTSRKSETNIEAHAPMTVFSDDQQATKGAEIQEIGPSPFTISAPRQETRAAVRTSTVPHPHDRDWVYERPPDGESRWLRVAGENACPNRATEIKSWVDPGQLVASAPELDHSVDR